MGTQGLVSVLLDGNVVVKAVAGSDGMQAKKLARRLKQIHATTKEQVYAEARAVGFGGQADLVVLDNLGQYLGTCEELNPRYNATFNQPRFNPRRAIGTAEYTEVVRLKRKATPVPAKPALPGIVYSEQCPDCRAAMSFTQNVFGSQGEVTAKDVGYVCTAVYQYAGGKPPVEVRPCSTKFDTKKVDCVMQFTAEVLKGVTREEIFMALSHLKFMFDWDDEAVDSRAFFGRIGFVRAKTKDEPVAIAAIRKLQKGGEA